jgi:CMP/dCMP kinase
VVIWKKILVNYIISIDGPAGSGKERISKYIARKYAIYHLDSGILYRRLANIVIKKRINIQDDKSLTKLINSIKYLSPNNNKALRSENISIISSKIAKKDIVRDFINKQQKIIIKLALKRYKGAVIDGRDIGSKVFKEAKFKLFITVTPEIRAKRRHKQLLAQGEKSIYAQILRGIKLRDKNDMNRKVSPLVIPKKAFLIDNSDSFRKTIKQINLILKKK